MTQTEVLLIAAIVGGFLILLLTLGAFVLGKYTAGVVALVLAGVCFVAALFLMAQVSVAQEDETRQAVLDKYDVTVEQWGTPLGASATWVVNGEEVDCVVLLEDRDDPTVRCNNKELPLEKQ
jgi:hypothetical protein